MEFRRGSTPTLTFPTGDLTTATVIVSLSQDGAVQVEYSTADLTLTSSSVSVTLTQEDTFRFAEGVCYGQVKYKSGTNVGYYPIEKIMVLKALNEDVM